MPNNLNLKCEHLMPFFVICDSKSLGFGLCQIKEVQKNQNGHLNFIDIRKIIQVQNQRSIDDEIILSRGPQKRILCLNLPDAMMMTMIVSTASPRPAVTEETCAAFVFNPRHARDLQTATVFTWLKRLKEITRWLSTGSYVTTALWIHYLRNCCILSHLFCCLSL